MNYKAQPFLNLVNMSTYFLKLFFLVLLHWFIHSVQYDQTLELYSIYSVQTPLSQSDCTVLDKTVTFLRRTRLLTLRAEKISTQTEWYTLWLPLFLASFTLRVRQLQITHTSLTSPVSHTSSLISSDASFPLLRPFLICPSPLLYCLLFGLLSQVTYDTRPNTDESDLDEGYIAIPCWHMSQMKVLYMLRWVLYAPIPDNL